jgi:hypothetical protein
MRDDFFSKIKGGQFQSGKRKHENKPSIGINKTFIAKFGNLHN